MPLENGRFLYLYQHLGLRRKQRYLTTLEYKYWYQATADSDSWIFRYEYLREPPEPFPYPRCHLHINANPGSYNGERPFAGLHLPVGERVTIEAVARHLVQEQGLRPVSPAWEKELAETEAEFTKIQRKRFA
jgi:hypothetical protein